MGTGKGKAFDGNFFSVFEQIPGMCIGMLDWDIVYNSVKTCYLIAQGQLPMQ